MNQIQISLQASIGFSINRQNLELSPNVPAQHAGFLAGKSFCLRTSQPGLSWIIDSGATDHITPQLQLFTSYKPVRQDCFITMPNGRKAQIKHVGTIVLKDQIILPDVLHVLDFQFNLLSASKKAKLMSSNAVFTPDSCYIQAHLKSQRLLLGKESGGLCLVNPSSSLKTLSQQQQACNATSQSISELWHCS